MIWAKVERRPRTTGSASPVLRRHESRKSPSDLRVAGRRLPAVFDFATHAAVFANERTEIVGHVELRHRHELAAAMANDDLRPERTDQVPASADKVTRHTALPQCGLDDATCDS
jgi:hypothetical protein